MTRSIRIVDAMWANAQEYFDQGQYLRARNCLQKLLQFDDHEPEIRTEATLLLSNAQAMLGEFEAARKTVRTALRFAPDDSDLQTQLGLLLLDDPEAMQENQKRSLTPLRKAMKLESESPETLMNYGEALFRQGEYVKAANAYRRALAEDRNRFEAWYQLAIALAEAGEYENAREIACHARFHFGQYHHGARELVREVGFVIARRKQETNSRKVPDTVPLLRLVHAPSDGPVKKSPRAMVSETKRRGMIKTD